SIEFRRDENSRWPNKLLGTPSARRQYQQNRFLFTLIQRRAPGITASRGQHSATEGATLKERELVQDGYYVHPSAYVDSPCEIGEGSKVWHFSHVMAHARLGKRCILGQNVHVASHVIIGDNVKIQ